MKNFISILIFFVICSCRQDIYSGLSYEAPNFKDSTSLEATVLNDTLYTKGAWGIATYKDYIILHTIMDDYMFQLYNLYGLDVHINFFIKFVKSIKFIKSWCLRRLFTELRSGRLL